MHIGQVLTLDEGIGPVECAGTVGYASDQQEGVGKKGAWTRQFIVLKEGNDDIGVTLWNARHIKNGERIVVKGTTQEYEGKITLSAKLSGNGQQSQPEQRQASNNNRKGSESVSIERQVCVKAVGQIFQGEGSAMDIGTGIKWCCYFHKWIQDGKDIPTMAGTPVGSDDEPPIDDDDIPF